MPLIRSLVSSLGLGALAAGCTPANQLQGSVGELTSLAFSQVVVTQSTASKTSPAQFVVSYRNSEDDAGAYSIPFELSVNLTGLPPLTTTNPPIDLGAVDPDAGTPVAATSRAVPGDTRTFPPIDRGHLWIDQDIQVGQQGAGHFFLVYGFPNDGSLGQGRTVEGHFQAVVNP